MDDRGSVWAAVADMLAACRSKQEVCYFKSRLISIQTGLLPPRQSVRRPVIIGPILRVPVPPKVLKNLKRFSFCKFKLGLTMNLPHC